MLFGPIFDYYDPKDGDVPNEFDSEFETIAFRARVILAERTRSEIIEAGETIDAMMEETTSSRVGAALDALAEEAETGIESPTSHSHRSPSSDLEWCMGRIDPAAVTQGAPFTWPELFAVLALALIAHGWEERHHLQTLELEDAFEETAFRNIGSYAVDAMEALAKAEMLVRVEELEADFENTVQAKAQHLVSTNNAAAAKRKHAPKNRVKRRFIHWYLENEKSGLFQSRSQAAQRFFRELSEEERRPFSDTNAPRTLLDALRNHFRENT